METIMHEEEFNGSTITILQKEGAIKGYIDRHISGKERHVVSIELNSGYVADCYVLPAKIDFLKNYSRCLQLAVEVYEGIVSKK